MPDVHEWSTHSAEEDNQIEALTNQLGSLLDKPPLVFSDQDEVKDLNYIQAVEIVRYARRVLVLQLLSQETHEHWLDDCGDYLIAATENWYTLFTEVWGADLDEAETVRIVKEFMQQEPVEWLGSDGEIRFSLFDTPYIESRYE